MPEIVNALYIAGIAAAGLAALLAAFAALAVIVVAPAYAWMRFQHWRNPPPDRTAEALRKLAGMRRRAFLDRRARRQAKREYIAARDTMKPERFREWAAERSRRAYEEWAERQQQTADA